MAKEQRAKANLGLSFPSIMPPTGSSMNGVVGGIMQVSNTTSGVGNLMSGLPHGYSQQPLYRNGSGQCQHLRPQPWSQPQRQPQPQHPTSFPPLNQTTICNHSASTTPQPANNQANMMGNVGISSQHHEPRSANNADPASFETYGGARQMPYRIHIPRSLATTLSRGIIRAISAKAKTWVPEWAIMV